MIFAYLIARDGCMKVKRWKGVQVQIGSTSGWSKSIRSGSIGIIEQKVFWECPHILAYRKLSWLSCVQFFSPLTKGRAFSFQKPLPCPFSQPFASRSSIAHATSSYFPSLCLFYTPGVIAYENRGWIFFFQNFIPFFYYHYSLIIFSLSLVSFYYYFLILFVITTVCGIRIESLRF